MIKGRRCFLGKKRVLLRHPGLQERCKLVPVPPVRMEGYISIWANEQNALVLDSELVAQVMFLVDKGRNSSREAFRQPLVNHDRRLDGSAIPLAYLLQTVRKLGSVSLLMELKGRDKDEQRIGRSCSQLRLEPEFWLL